jgi:hypothetical protein
MSGYERAPADDPFDRDFESQQSGTDAAKRRGWLGVKKRISADENNAPLVISEAAETERVKKGARWKTVIKKAAEGEPMEPQAPKKFGDTADRPLHHTRGRREEHWDDMSFRVLPPTQEHHYPANHRAYTTPPTAVPRPTRPHPVHRPPRRAHHCY